MVPYSQAYLPRRRHAATFPVLALAALAAAACAGTRKPAGGGAGTGGSGSSGSGTGTGGSSTTGSGSGGSSGSGSGGSSGKACQMFTINFEPKVPTVFVLVDRSGSMFDSGGWEPLRMGVLDVVKSLQNQIRFAFGSFTGEIGQTCPMFDKVPADLNNYEPIAALYNSLKKPTKGETPTSQTMALVKDILKNDPAPGDRFILFVTDGEPDYCSDGNALCPVDSVVGVLQNLHAAQITTFVFGVQSTLANVSPATLQAFANAGGGFDVVPTAPKMDIFNQCFYGGDANAIGWKADFAAAGKNGTANMGDTLGTYMAGTNPGNAMVFKPSATDQKALTDQIASVVSGVKSCLFDLTGKIRVDTKQLAKAGVKIEGMSIQLDETGTNGWHMKSETQLELVGDACATWRKPETKTIDFNFPCEIITPI
jgi:hypothetical protein